MACSALLHELIHVQELHGFNFSLKPDVIGTGVNVYREDRYALAALYGDFYTLRGLVASSLFQWFLSLETVIFRSFEEEVAPPES